MPRGRHCRGRRGRAGRQGPRLGEFQPSSWRYRPGGYSYFYGGGPNAIHYGHTGCDSDEEFGTGGAAAFRRHKPPPKPEQIEQEVIRVDSVDFKVAENTSKHHTNEFEITEGDDPQLVVRRGQQFTIQINFSRPYDSKKDDLRLVFQIGESPKASKGTHVEFVLSDKDKEGEWGAKIARQSGKSLTINVFTPPDCIVGKWLLKVNVVKRKENKTVVFCYNHKNPIYMLFNPWCKEDTVYMEKPADRDAYVLSDQGKIFSGNYRSITSKPWVFGQFSGKVLDCCMFILDLSEMALPARSNPILVARKLTALINSQDEGGVLTGNWSGDYEGGKSPLSWTGSAAILEQFYWQQSPVSFGQCWVFSGVLTTVCRALGLPARSVTNFSSAHDVDTSITIDVHFTSSGESNDDLDEDSIWNFHVWNEVWMARPDLATGYGGWQACDATPQEASDNVYCCGPCPVRAIKEGEVNVPYDGPFIFAEVNADRVYWLENEDGSWENVYEDKKVVGKFMSTMQPADGSREDVTNLYKFPEESPEERVAVRKANMVGSNRKDVYKTGPQDVEFDLCYDSENSFVGSDFKVELCCKNTSKEKRSIDGQIGISTVYYTGVVAESVAKQVIEQVELKPGETKKVTTVSITPDLYHCKLKDCCMLTLNAMTKVYETKQIFTKKDDIRLRKPHLNIKAPKSGKIDTPIQVEMSFTNPLNKTLTDCTLEVEGPGLSMPKTSHQSDLPPKGTFFTTITLTPKKKGARQIVAIFNSRQLEDINGSHAITIQG